MLSSSTQHTEKKCQVSHQCIPQAAATRKLHSLSVLQTLLPFECNDSFAPAVVIVITFPFDPWRIRCFVPAKIEVPVVTTVLSSVEERTEYTITLAGDEHVRFFLYDIRQCSGWRRARGRTKTRSSEPKRLVFSSSTFPSRSSTSPIHQSPAGTN